MSESKNWQSEQALLSRRAWLGRFAIPVVGATFAGGAFDRAAAAAERAPERENGNDRGARLYNIRDFGAQGKKTTLDTKALQAAIDACNRDGGGTVLVPAGTFTIGTVELKSNVTLRIAAGGTLLGSADGKQYHAVDAIPLSGDTTLEDGNWALLFAVDAKNITIEGPGTMDGQGAQFHSPVRGAPPPSGLGGRKRPYHVLLYHCENVVVRDISMLDCAYHSIRIIQSRRIQLNGIYIHNRVNGNNDGFHFISAEHVSISDCTLLCGDDACAMFGSCKNVTVTNSFFSTRWSVFRFGGGHAENIAVSNCILSKVYGCPIKFQGDPGSQFQNMSFSNLVLDEVTGPISISVGGRLPAPNDKVPVVVRNISFSHIHGTVTTNPPHQLAESNLTVGSRPGEAHSAIVLNSVNGSVLENISFDDVHLVFCGGGTAEEGANRNVPEVFGEYFRLGPIPAYGLYARNARHLTLHNVRLETSAPDLRPAVILDNVEDAAFSGLAVKSDPQAQSVLRFTNCKQVLITAARTLTPSPTFLRLEGSENQDIVLDGGDLSRAAATLALDNGATKEAVRIRTI